MRCAADATREILYEQIVDWAQDMAADARLQNAIRAAADEPPADFTRQGGWVLIALQNALWQMLHAFSLEEGVVDTVMRGGDTDTNAAIAGALLGAVQGRWAIPRRWEECVLNCRPDATLSHVYRPRPRVFWPVDALELAESLLGA